MPKTISYGPTISTPEGTLYSAQSAAGRAAKAWVIVRYRDLDDPGEIIYEHGAVIQTLWHAPDGHLHAMCSKGFHHTNETGAWKKTRVKQGDARGYLVWGHGERLFLGVQDELHERRGKAYEVRIPGVTGASTDFVSAMDATSEALYASRGDGQVLRSSGETWTPLHLPRPVGPNTVVCLAEDDVYVSTRLGLYRGAGTASLALVDETPQQYGARFGGKAYVASYGKGVHRVDGTKLEPIAEGFSVTWMHGGAYLCITGMEPAIQIFDGTRWTRKVAAV